MSGWTEKDLDMAQTAMFDVMLDQIVPSLRAADCEDGDDDED